MSNIIKVQKVEGIPGGPGSNVYCILAQCKEMAQREHCIVEIEMNGKKARVDEHTPFWVTVKLYETGTL